MLTMLFIANSVIIFTKLINVANVMLAMLYIANTVIVLSNVFIGNNVRMLTM